MKRNELIKKIRTLYNIRTLRFPMQTETVISVQGKQGFENITINDYPEKQFIIADNGRFLGKTKIKYEQIF